MSTLTWGRCALLTGLALAAATAQAAPTALSNGSTVTATLLGGPATGLLSLDDGYTAAANPASAAVSSAFGDFEFLSDDYALAIDWTDDGVLTVWNNVGAALSSDYTLQFSFAGRLAAYADLAGAGLITSVSGDVLTLTVQAADFTSAFEGVAAAQIEVPEPGTWALAFTGLLAAAATRRRAGR